MENLMEITRPTLLISEKRARQNILTMREKAWKSGVAFRPHFKTHQSALIGEWFREYGIDRITVSSVEMAEYFAENKWTDITIAFPVNIREIDAINRLAGRARLQLLVESEETVGFLAKHIAAPVGVWIKIDVGYHRTGVNWSDTRSLTRIAAGILSSSKLTLRGLLTHAGHAYHAGGRKALRQIYRESTTLLQEAKNQLQRAGISPLALSYGDTPTCSVVEDFSAVDEIRPGNFVFYDLMQLGIGSCREEDIAAAVVCPVVARYPRRQEVVIHGGAIHLSKESLQDVPGQTTYGAIAFIAGNQWGKILPQCFVSSLSQEHGILQMSRKMSGRVKIGELLAVIPVHSCLTMNLMRKFRVV